MKLFNPIPKVLSWISFAQPFTMEELTSMLTPIYQTVRRLKFVFPQHRQITNLGTESRMKPPEAIEASLERLMSIEPLIFSPEEQAAWDAAEAERKRWEKDHFMEWSDPIADEFK